MTWSLRLRRGEPSLAVQHYPTAMTGHWLCNGEVRQQATGLGLSHSTAWLWPGGQEADVAPTVED